MSTLYNKLIQVFITLSILALIAYGLNLALYFYLPKSKVSSVMNEENSLEYERFNLKEAMTTKKIKSAPKTKKVQKKKNEYQLLSNIKLIAIYDLGNGDGVITITSKGKSDSTILGIGEEFKGYTLKSVHRDYAVFTKNNKEYRVAMDLKDDTSTKFTTTVQKPQPQTKEEIRQEIDENIQINDESIKVNRTYMNSYINDFNKIWKDISITEHKVNGKINGFKVNRLKKASAFEKLGLKKGDIIKSVNNIELKSYNAAFNLYNKIDKTKSINMIILRKNQEVEINYEIE